jgi:hypothetical protein
MHNIIELDERYKRHGSEIDFHYDVTAYLDTVECFLPRLTTEQYRTCRRFGQIKECRNHRDQLWGYRLILNQPDPQTLLRVDPLVEQYRGTVCRFDLAIDIQAPDPEAVKQLILRQAVLRWRRRGPMHEAGEHRDETVYWSYGKGWRTKNLVIYADKHNRFTGELGCVHLELRFLRTKTVRVQGVHRITDLFKVNPKALFDRHVKWSDDADKYVLKVIRKAVKEDIARWQNKPTHQFARYRASLPALLKTRMRIAGVDRAQTIKDRGRDMKAITCPLPIPASLTWQSSLQF